jgi:uncharacterized damage-inducible protein DinB
LSSMINWRLNNTAMSFAHLIQHIIDVDELFFSLVSSKEKQFYWKMGSEEPHFEVKEKTYDAMVKKLKEFQQKRYTIISSLDASKMNEKITDDNNETITLWWFIMRKVLEHEIYHRGQLAAYLKVLKGESSEI